jgi:hypothetical protein
LGNEFFRFFDVRQASAITTSGQLSIRWIESKINVFLNKLLGTDSIDYVIASDTDSAYISFDELVRQTIKKQKPDASVKEIIDFLDRVCESKIQPFIDKSYNELFRYINAYQQKMRMKREALADRGIWTAKKRYILNVYNNEGVEYKIPKVKYMGLEVVKSSTPSSCREKLKESINIILSKSEDDLILFIQKYKEEFKTLPLADISFPRSVNTIDKYDINSSAVPIHVRAAIVHNNLLKINNLQKKYPSIKQGEKIKFIYLKEPNPAKSHVVAFTQVLPDEFGLRSYIDYNTQFEKAYLEPLRIILNCIGWKTEKTNSLVDFFS